MRQTEEGRLLTDECKNTKFISIGLSFLTLPETVSMLTKYVVVSGDQLSLLIHGLLYRE